MKIAVYTPISLQYGGGFENWLFSIVPRLQERGYEFTIIDTDFCPQKRLSSKEVRQKINNSQYHTIKTFHFKTMFPKPNNYFKIKEYCRDCDLIYLNSGFMTQDIIFWLIKKKLKKKIICGYHGPIFNNIIHNLFFRTISKRILSKFDGHHVMNSNDFKLLKSWGFKNVFKIPHGIDTSKFAPKGKKENDKLKILFVGRHEKQKGIDLLLKAIEIFLKRNKNSKAEFGIAGRGPFTPLVKKYSKKFKEIKYLGFVDDVIQTYSDYNILIVPSRMEPFGLVIIEANSCGLPVIASRTYGSEDIIEENKNGFFIETPSNEINISKSIEMIYNIWKSNPEKLRKMEEESRKIAVQNYSIEKMINGLDEMFKKSLNNNFKK